MYNSETYVRGVCSAASDVWGSVTECDGVQMWDLYLYNGDSSFHFAAAQPSPGQAVMADG